LTRKRIVNTIPLNLKVNGKFFIGIRELKETTSMAT
jgi:hypothetical protein